MSMTVETLTDWMKYVNNQPLDAFLNIKSSSIKTTEAGALFLLGREGRILTFSPATSQIKSAHQIKAPIMLH